MYRNLNCNNWYSHKREKGVSPPKKKKKKYLHIETQLTTLIITALRRILELIYKILLTYNWHRLIFEVKY